MKRTIRVPTSGRVLVGLGRREISLALPLNYLTSRIAPDREQGQTLEIKLNIWIYNYSVAHKNGKPLVLKVIKIPDGKRYFQKKWTHIWAIGQTLVFNFNCCMM